MGVFEARGSLEKAFRELMLKWTETKLNWDDPVSRAFEEKFIRPMQMDLRNATGAMDQMAALLHQLYHDCQ